MMIPAIHQVSGPKAASRPLHSGFEIAFSGQILVRPPAVMPSGTPMITVAAAEFLHSNYKKKKNSDSKHMRDIRQLPE